MKIVLIIAVSCLLSLNHFAYTMDDLQCADAENKVHVEDVPLLFGRVLLKLLHEEKKEFDKWLHVLKEALRRFPSTDIDYKCMVLHPHGPGVSIRIYYKAMKRKSLNSCTFAHLSLQEREALQKERCQAVEKLFSDAGKPL